MDIYTFMQNLNIQKSAATFFRLHVSYHVLINLILHKKMRTHI